MKNILFLLALLFSFTNSFSQVYTFEQVINLETTEVISQGTTGTCWSFSTSSFLESEIKRLTGKQIDVSEMYQVRHTYPKKAWNYVMRQGKAQFGEGGLAHDVMNSIRENGLVPKSVYSGMDADASGHNHAELAALLKGMLDVYIDNPSRSLSPKWQGIVSHTLDTYLGKDITDFTYEGVQYTPKSFQAMTKINPDNYVSLTSFTHHPFYSQFILNIPDNFSNGSFYNVTLDDMMATLNRALENGYTVELDCDVSERTFSAKQGLAVIPDDEAHFKEIMTQVRPEKNITQAYRQQEFESYATQDDHLMHITGTMSDQNGKIYYKVKNSWGTDDMYIANGGFVYMSEAYMRLKTIAIMIHKDAMTKDLKKKLKL
ncbi:aminopeptidase [Bizionia argentinensis JUB59]|uniref:Aminopeptidase n=1 Tax=Bizionia argentinensis JUB59 TaxID=1046627 RepID=G2E9W0_9FLAO|nr:C1 family peptidase [Bizionia argentinensis]EGV45083.1 aminopeptidase [Bizionia argentinensis JUB59]